MTKTNKSFLKRIRVTRNGKLVVRAKGQDHFNAKESGKARLKRKKQTTITLPNKVRGRFFQD